MKIRCQTPQGRKVISEITSESSLKQLKTIIFSLTDIPNNQQKISLGYPPQLISSNASNDEIHLQELGIKHGESITVEQISKNESLSEKNNSTINHSDHITNNNNNNENNIPKEMTHPSSTNIESVSNDSSSTTKEIPEIPSVAPSNDLSELGEFVRRQIPSDNSCLFHSISYAILGATSRPKFSTLARGMRELVVDTISTDPVFYNEGVLGMDVSEYKKWIRGNDHWGGPIELHALSTALQIEIVAFDVKTQRADHYTPSSTSHTSESLESSESPESPKHRIYLVFDGIHYDTLALTPLLSDSEASDDIRIDPSSLSEEVDMTLFSPQDQRAFAKAQAVIRALQHKRQFTDLQEFTLRCQTCQKGLKGQQEATEHAKQTGHANFSEYN